MKNKRNKKGVLAINGGMPILKKSFNTGGGLFPPIHVVGKEEIAAATRVIKRGPLSGFAGVNGALFFGGPEVQAFEKEFAKKFRVAYAVSCNSATSALHMAIVALGIGPGDEVIVPPYTMAASVTAVILNGAVPIFADIDPRTFCLDPKSVEKCITKRTKAIMAVNLMGQGVDFGKLVPLARKYGLKIIEDNAQSPGAKWRNQYLGTIGDIGVFSLNIHKIMQTGEGGVLVTNNKAYALRAQLSRNHGESVADQMEHYSAGPILGNNYRMTEVVAAMARVQLKRLDFLIRKRLVLVKRLTRAIKNIPGFTTPYTLPDNFNVTYYYAMLVDEKKLGLTRDQLLDAMAAEGFDDMSRGYVKPIYLTHLFKERKAFNNTHFPFDYNGMSQNYVEGICPVAERLWKKEFTFTEVCQYPYTVRHVDLFVKALKKVIEHKDEIA
ncbi:MAG: DegT/DnrJ/EryC1/StrS family aminotransferase [bacterium]|nr:DegT/DnrJ/EryC1/StrS family aminotransferase [bacterium]